MLVVANRTLLYGRLWSTGDVFEVDDSTGKSLVKKGFVTEKMEMVGAELASTTTPKTAKKPRQKPEKRETKPLKGPDLEQK